MALTRRFIPHAIKIATAGGAVAAWINQIKSYGPDQGVALIEESGGSQIDREFVSVRSVEPKMQIATTDLSFLSTCGLAGVHIVPDSSNAGLIAYGREQQSGAAPTAIATTNHITMIVTDGDLFPQSSRGSHNQVALFNLMLLATLGSVATYSGAAPMLFATGAAIPSGASAVANIYVPSVVKFNSTLLQGIMDLGFDFGIEAKQQSDSGDIYASMNDVDARNPKGSFTTKDLSVIAAIGEALAVTSFAMYFQKCTANGERVAKSATSHIKISGTNGLITPAAQTLAHKQSGMAPFTWTPVLDTTIIAVSTSSAIPTS